MCMSPHTNRGKNSVQKVSGQPRGLNPKPSWGKRLTRVKHTIRLSDLYWWNRVEKCGIVHKVTYFSGCTSSCLPRSVSVCLTVLFHLCLILRFALSFTLVWSTHLGWCFFSSLLRSFLVYHIRHVPKRLSTVYLSTGSLVKSIKM